MSLYEKIYNIMNESGALEKDKVVGSGTNAYKAVSESEVLNMLKPLFKKHRLVVFPVSGDISEISQTWTGEYNGKTETKSRNITQLKANFKIVDIDTGESETLVGFGNGADSQDKGSGKAFTYAYKTMLSKTFMLFSGDDTDNEHSDNIGKVVKVPTYQATPYQAKPDENTQTTKATAAQVKEVFKLYKEKNPNSETADYFAWVDELHATGKISSKFSSNKDKTEIYWTLADIITMKNEIELPF
jgi:hypothetical protein